jgi:thymidylate synthase
MLYRECNTLVTNAFNSDYFRLHNELMKNGATVNSRNGNTKEFLNFKTVLNRPYQSCVGGLNRNPNIFFLLAEAMWIFKGRRDVEFLTIFNKQMADYSDDGKYFHAPYGWRLRRYGLSSFINLNEQNMHHFEQAGTDQLKECLLLLQQNPEDRRVVANIWNPDLDLGTKSKDLPCNDTLMFIIRDNALHQTIANRSNDLNWGLTTNVFQFSFIGQIMANLLGVTYGSQTHNSRSLHLYVDNDLTKNLQTQIDKSINYNKKEMELPGTYFYNSVFSNSLTNMPIDFTFKVKNLSLVQKLYWVDFYLHSIIIRLLSLNKENNSYSKEDDLLFKQELKEFSYYFYCVYETLAVYVNYKKHKSHEKALNELTELGINLGLSRYDFYALSLNFFVTRIKGDEYRSSIVNYIEKVMPIYKTIPLGRL